MFPSVNRRVVSLVCQLLSGSRVSENTLNVALSCSAQDRDSQKVLLRVFVCTWLCVISCQRVVNPIQWYDSCCWASQFLLYTHTHTHTLTHTLTLSLSVWTLCVCAGDQAELKIRMEKEDLKILNEGLEDEMVCFSFRFLPFFFS